MIEISQFINEFSRTLKNTFSDRIWFMGLQGSYVRGEATDSSDIDIVVILDEVNLSDVESYNSMLDTLPNRELMCGFLSGKRELLSWEPSDLFQLCFDTKPIIGTLDDLKILFDEDVVNRAIRIGACNVYHGCVHNMLYDKDEHILRGLYKSASFVVRAIVFKETGEYIYHLRDLISVLSDEDKTVIETFIALKKGDSVSFREMSETLFNWSKKWIIQT